MRDPQARIFWALVLTAMLIAPSIAEAASFLQSGDPQEEEQEEEERTSVEEVVVVTASGNEQLLLEAPTAVSVIDSADIALSPAQNYADLLRGIPGLNVTQTGARDINLRARSATSTLDASQLVLIDGRSVYQDFFGFVAWDLLPVDFSEIAQIEVVRGPGSAVWGANAMSGVVNIITKDPRSVGDAVRVRAGGGQRGTGFGSLTWTGVSDTTAFRFTGSYYTQEPWERPGPLPNGTPRNIFPSQGTEQPKFDGRIDFGQDDETWWSVRGGIAGSGGTIHTGIGPFNIQDGTTFWYGRLDFNHEDLNVKAYANILDGDATNLLNGIRFLFESQTYDFSLSNSVELGDHGLNYGGNFRTINFDLSIAPEEDQRSEGGGYVSADINAAEWLSIDAGVRVDKFSVLDDAVVSPRGALLIHPAGNNRHVFRAGFGRAFRAPSMINNFLDVMIFNQVALPTGPFVFPSVAFGNPNLTETKLDQYELGYRGSLGDGRVSWDIAVYRTETEDSIDFFTKNVYTAFNPPPNWPLPTFFLPPFGPVLLPSEFSYRNVGEFENQGVEVSFRVEPFARNNIIASYSWQDEPEVTGIPANEVNIPPSNRLHLAWNGYADDLYYSAAVNYQDEAFWTDVLDSRFFGFSDSFTTVDATLGYLFLDGTAEASVRATNLFDEDMQQHAFGDIIGRRVLLELALNVR